MLVWNDPEMRSLPTRIYWDEADEQEREPEDDDDDDEDEEDESASDDDDDEEYLAERIIICNLARPLYPDKDIRVRIVCDVEDTAFTAVIQVHKTNDALMNGAEKTSEYDAYRDLYEMIREELQKRGLWKTS